MFKVSKFSVISCILLFVFAIYIVCANVFDYQKLHLPFAKAKFNLGLDLKGGTHLLLQADFKGFVNQKFKNVTPSIIKGLRSAGVNYDNFTLSNDSSSLIVYAKKENADKIKEVINDLRFGLSATESEPGKFVISYSKLALDEMRDGVLSQSIEIVRKRVDESGTKEILLYTQGEDKIVLEVPGVYDPEMVKSLLNTTAKMTFHLMDDMTPIVSNRIDPKEIKKDGFTIMNGYDPLDDNFYLVSENIEIDGINLVDAKATIGQQGPSVSFVFDKDGAYKFGKVTRDNVGKPFAIVIDERVISSPVIREPIEGGSGVISGHFSLDEAKKLALLLRSGALPTPINIIEEGIVGPNLGSESIKAGKVVFCMSLLFVAVLMLLRYRVLGVISCISLLFNIVLLLGIVSIFNMTLTLPGIAGIALTIGMAVDANVLVFERIMEELRSSTTKARIKSYQLGFQGALSSILDSNITTILCALVIYYFGFGPIRGFAATISAGIITSIFSCIVVSRILTYFALKYKILQ